MTTVSSKCVLFAITSPYGVSRSALNKATQLASGLGAELKLFYRAYDSEVIHPTGPGPQHPGMSIHAYVEQRKKLLSDFASQLSATGLRVSANVEWDSRSDEGILGEVLRLKPAFV